MEHHHTHEHKRAGPITQDITIGEFVEQYPDLVEILLAEGVHCVGCGASYYETIGEGLAGHGKTQEEIDACITKLNDEYKALSGASSKTEEVTITEKAGTKLKEILASNKKEGMGLRIRVMPGGCAGFKYSLELEQKEAPEDKVIEVSGSKFFIDQNSLGMLKGAKVDYIEGLQDSGFKINNPNATSSCGCGKSFS